LIPSNESTLKWKVESESRKACTRDDSSFKKLASSKLLFCMKTSKILECVTCYLLASLVLTPATKQEATKQSNTKLQVEMSHDMGEDSL
jgi:hypothetical protein